MRRRVALLSLVALTGTAFADTDLAHLIRDTTAAIVASMKAPKTVAAPTAPAANAIDTCTKDSDCTLYFRVSSCTPGDPMAVNTKQQDAARKKFPVKREECGMGGPQFDELRQREEGRYSAACVKQHCVVNDKGPQPTMRERMKQAIPARR